MIDKLFHSAVIRLTMWYMVIILVMSLLFSGIVFSLASREIERAFGPRRPGEISIFINSDEALQLRHDRINDSNGRLVLNLVVFNIMTLALGGICSYLLARRTLAPIEDALEMQSRFSSDAAHELRTPLAIMRTETEVALRDKKAGKPQLTETLQSNLDEIERLQTLTSRLLLLSEQHELELVPVQIDEVASEALTRAVPLASAKSIAIDNRVAPAMVQGNYDALVDTLGILIDNAIKYSPEKSTIMLNSRQQDGRVVIDVADKGEGIAKADQARIFDRFYRTDESRSSQHVEGHGLGLSIAKRLMEAQKGGVSVVSELGKGSVFSIRIPAI